LLAGRQVLLLQELHDVKISMKREAPVASIRYNILIDCNIVIEKNYVTVFFVALNQFILASC
jgi:hypothetical protein